MTNKKILVVAAHPDDELLGCGATLLRFRKQGCKIKVIFLTDGESSRSNTKNLDISKSTAKSIYEKAITSANNKQFENANETFESILLDYPYSIWATL